MCSLPLQLVRRVAKFAGARCMSRSDALTPRLFTHLTMLRVRFKISCVHVAAVLLLFNPLTELLTPLKGSMLPLQLVRRVA